MSNPVSGIYVSPETAIHLTTFTFWQVICICASVIGSAFGLAWWLSGKFSELNSKFTSIDGDLNSIKGWMGSLLIALEGKVAEKSLKQLTHQLGGFQAKATGNPISPEEARKINYYLDKVKSEEALGPEEALEFKSIVDKFVTDEDIKKKVAKENLDLLILITGGAYAKYYLGLQTTTP